MTKNALPYCGQLVQEQDPDRFLLSLIAPAGHREALWALFAFNYEIARIRETVTEPMLGRIRLQWWREAIEKIYTGDNAPKHQVATALQEVIAAYNLPRDEFLKLVDAREFDLEDRVPPSAGELLSYIESTTVPLHTLMLQIVGADPASEPVRAVSLNYGLTGLLRAVPFHGAQGRSFMPQPPTPDFVKTLCMHFTQGPRPSARLLKSLQALSRLYLRQLEQAGYDVHSLALRQPPAFKEIRVLAGSIF